jgi:hypothetical protein
MRLSSPLLVPDRIERVRQVPIELHGSYQDLGTHVLPRGAKGPDLNSVNFTRLIASIVDWAGDSEPAESH